MAEGAKPQEGDPEEVIAVRSPYGEGGTAKRKDLADLQARGYSLEAPEDTHRRALQAAYGDSPVTTALESAASTATLGASKWIERKVLNVNPEAIEARAQLNPVANIGGAIAGVAVPWGPLSVFGRAGEAAAAAVRPAVAGLEAGGAVARIAAKAIPTVVGGVAENAAFGGAQALAEVALDDKPITVQRIMAAGWDGMTSGAKWGLAGGLGAAGIEAVAPIARAGLAKVGGKIEDAKAARSAAVAEIPEAVPSITDEALADVNRPFPKRNAQADAAVRAERKAVSADLETEQGHVLDAQARRDAALSDAGSAAPAEDVSQRAAQFREKYETLHTESGKTYAMAERKLKAGEFTDPEQAAAVEAGIAEVRAAREASAEALGVSKVKSGEYKWSRTDRETISALREEGSPSAASMRRTEDAMHSLRTAQDGATFDRIDPHAVVGEAPAVRDVFAELPPPRDLAKLKQLVARDNELTSMLPTPEGTRLNVHRWNQEVIASAGKAGIAATDEQIIAGLRASGYDGASLERFGKLPADAQDAMRAQFYRAAAPLKLAESEAVASQGIAEATAAKKAAIAKTGAQNAMVGGAIGKVAGVAAAAGADWLLGDTPFGHVIAGMIGVHIHGWVKGRLFDGVTGTLARKGMDIAERSVKVADAALGAAQKGAKYAPRATIAVLNATKVNPVAQDEPKAKTLGDAYQRVAKDAAAAVADPQGTEKAIHANLAPAIAANVSVGSQLVSLALKRLQYLYEQMPKDPGTKGPFDKSDYRPSDAEICSFGRCVAAADDPVGQLHQEMASGMLCSETVETVKALYPDIYAHVQSTLVDKASELKKTLPWETQVTLSTFFGVPISSVLRPEMVMQFQASFAPDSEHGTGGQKPPKPGSIQKPEPTQAQRLNDR